MIFPVSLGPRLFTCISVVAAMLLTLARQNASFKRGFRSIGVFHSVPTFQSQNQLTRQFEHIETTETTLNIRGTSAFYTLVLTTCLGSLPKHYSSNAFNPPFVVRRDRLHYYAFKGLSLRTWVLVSYLPFSFAVNSFYRAHYFIS